MLTALVVMCIVVFLLISCAFIVLGFLFAGAASHCNSLAVSSHNGSREKMSFERLKDSYERRSSKSYILAGYTTLAACGCLIVIGWFYAALGCFAVFFLLGILSTIVYQQGSRRRVRSYNTVQRLDAHWEHAPAA